MTVDHPLFTGQEIKAWLHDLHNQGIMETATTDSPPPIHLGELGAYVAPSEHRWHDHRSLILDPSYGLHFSPEGHPCFDGVIQQYCAALSLPDSSHHDAPLRENLAVVRNYLTHERLQQHPQHPIQHHLVAAAHRIAEGLNNDTEEAVTSAFLIRKALANQPITGAFYIYEQIHDTQPYTSWIDPQQQPIAVEHATSVTYQTVESLDDPTRRESVDIAKEILEKLKLKLGDALIENGLSAFSNGDLTIMDALKGAVRVYEFHLHKLMKFDATIMEHPAVRAANLAIGKLGYLAKLELLKTAERIGNSPLANSAKQQIGQMSKAWQAIAEKTFGELLGQVESGLDTVLMRLNQMQGRDSASNYWLGFSHENNMGRQDPSLKKETENQKSMADDAYYRQLQAQRAMRAQQQQATMAHKSTLTRQDDERQHQGPNATARKPATMQPTPQQPTRTPPAVATQIPAAPKAGMGALLGKDQMAAMRKMLATDANAEAIEVGRKQQIIQQELQRQQQVKAGKQAQAQAAEKAAIKGQQAKNIEQALKQEQQLAAKKQAQAQAQTQQQPLQPTIKAPTHNPNKRDPSRGL